MFNDVNLGTLLLLFVNKITSNMQFNIINTDNESFPEKYRKKNITASSFWADIYRNDDPDKILERYVDFITMLPIGMDVYKPIDIELIYDWNVGFYTPIRTEDGQKGYKMRAPVIYITLKPEDYKPDNSD